MQISVVIPTYNRHLQLSDVVDHLLASDVEDLGGLEIIVVDDGSPDPVGPQVATRPIPSSIAFRVVRQSNAGPAAARNRGFRESKGAIVLFIDDDVICPPQLVRQHVAAHNRFPETVIFGRYPFIQPQEPASLHKYLASRGFDVDRECTSDFLEVPMVASGQISFERAMFQEEGRIYRDDMATPAAEEYELSARLRSRGITILHGVRIVALHTQPVTLSSLSIQAYKYGFGTAEAICKCPGAVDLPGLRAVVDSNWPARRARSFTDSVKKTIKMILSGSIVRRCLNSWVMCAEHSFAADRFLQPIYHGAFGVHFFAGVRDGLRRFDCDRTEAATVGFIDHLQSDARTRLEGECAR